MYAPLNLEYPNKLFNLKIIQMILSEISEFLDQAIIIYYSTYLE